METRTKIMENNEFWRVAAKDMLEKKKQQINPATGKKYTQSYLADLLGVTSTHLGGCLSETDDRNAGHALQEAFAAYFGTTVYEMLQHGRKLRGLNGGNVETRQPQPLYPLWEAEALAGKSPDRLNLEVAEWGSAIQGGFIHYCDMIRNRVATLAEDRNRLYKKLARLEAETVKAVPVMAQVRLTGTLLSEMGIGIVMGDVDRNPVLINEAMGQILGMEIDEVFSLTGMQGRIMTLASPRGKVEYAKFMERSVDSEAHLDADIEFNDGVTYHIRRRPSYNGQGEFMGPVSIFRALRSTDKGEYTIPYVP